MTLNETTRKNLEAEIKFKLISLLEVFGLSREDMEELGINDNFMSKLVDDVYLKYFSPEEIEEIVAFDSRFKSRNQLVQKDFEKAIRDLFIKVAE